MKYALHDIDRLNPIADWMVWLTLGTLLAYVLVKILFPKYWFRFFQAMLFNLETEKLLKEKNINLLQLAFTLNVLGLISLSLFAYNGLLFCNLGLGLDSEGLTYILLFLTISVLTLLKFFSLQLLGWLFKEQNLCLQLNHSWLIHFKNFSLIILLCAILLIFVPSGLKTIPFYLGLLTISSMLVLNYLRAFQILHGARISILYGILYLCTLEILPIVVVSKVLLV